MKRNAALLLALLMLLNLCSCADGAIRAEQSGAVQSGETQSGMEQPEVAEPGSRASVLDGKKIIFVGCSYTYYGGVVIKDDYYIHSQKKRADDRGYFYQLCKANGADVSVMDWCYGGHDLTDMFDGHCDANDNKVEKGHDHAADLIDRYYDYVVLQEIKVPEPWTAEQYYANIKGVMDLFRAANPDVKFFYVIHDGVYTGNYPAGWKKSVKLVEQEGAQIVDWGTLVWDVWNGHVDVPGTDTVYNKSSFIVSRNSSDGYHPNLLSGYLSALMTYCAITGETAVGQPNGFYNDTEVNTYFDVERFRIGEYWWDDPNTEADERKTNFVEIFESDADMKGLQMLADEYLAKECKLNAEYTVIFQEPDGSVISSKAYLYGDKVTAPVKSGETFAGWDKEIVRCAGKAVYTAVYR